MTNYIDLISIFTACLIFGGMVFFTCFMAPLIFIKLPQQVAGNFIRQVFPWYYLVFGVLSIALALLLIFHPLKWLLAIMAACALAFLLARQWLMPKINHYRDIALQGDQSADRMFSNLHRMSVFINSLQLIGILIVFYYLIK